MKNTIKRIISAFLAVAMILCCGIVSFANESEDMLLYKETFASTGDWQSLYTLGSGAKFAVANNALTITATPSNGGQSGMVTGLPKTEWGDYTIEADVSVNGNNEFDTFSIMYKYIFQYRLGMISWFRKNNEFYFSRDTFGSFAHRGNARHAVDYKPYWNENGEEVKASAEGIFDPNGTNHLKLETRNGKLKFWVNDKLVFDFVETTPIDNGGIGFGAFTEGANPFSVNVTSVEVTGKEYDHKEVQGNIQGGVPMLQERFTNNADNWEAIDGHNNGSYAIEEAEYSKALALTAPDGKDMWVKAKTDALNSNTTLTTYAKSMGAGYQVIMRYESINRYYYFDISEKDGGTISLYKRLNNDNTLLASVSGVEEKANIKLSDWNTLRFRAEDDKFYAYAGIQLDTVLSYTDTNTGILTGSCGVGVSGGKAMIDDVEIYQDAAVISGVQLYPMERIEELDMNHKDKEDNVYKDIYVSTSGTNSGNGTKSNPYNTVQKAVDSLEAINDTDVTGNIVIHVEGGRYELDKPLTFTEKKSGKNGYYVILKGENGRPNISAGKKVTNQWTQSDIPNVYKASIDAPVEGFKEFYVNGNRKFRAGEWHYEPQVENLVMNNETNKPIAMIMPKTIMPEVAHPEEIELQVAASWRSYHPKVKDIVPYDEYNNYVTFGQKDLELAANGFYGVSLGTRLLYFLRVEGAKEMLNEPGEFYYDKREKCIYYYPEEGEDLNTANCVIPNHDQALLINGTGVNNRAKNIKIQGIDFSDTGWEYMTKNGYMNDQYPNLYNSDTSNGKIAAPNNTVHILVTAGVVLDFAQDIKFEDNVFHNFGGAGIHALNAVDNFSIVGNVIDDIADCGIMAGAYGQFASYYMKYAHHLPYKECDSVPKNIMIKNNVIRNVSRVYHSSGGIVTTYTRNLYILNNDIQGSGVSGMSLGMGWAASVSGVLSKTCVMNNRITNYNYQRDMYDSGCIYTLSATMGSIIAENYTDNESGGAVGTVYLDQGSSYYTVSNNVSTNTMNTVFANVNDHSNLFARNYTTTNKTPANAGFASSIITETHEISNDSDEDWPAIAVKVKETAGLQEGYEYLFDRLTEESEQFSHFNRLECYVNGKSQAYKRGHLTQMMVGRDDVQAEIVDGQLYLPFREMEQMTFVDRHTYGTGLSCAYNPNDKVITLAFLDKSSEDPQIISTKAGETTWKTNGNEYENLAPVIMGKNGEPLIPVQVAFDLMELGRKVVVKDGVAVVCDNGYDIDLTQRKDIYNTILAKIKY